MISLTNENARLAYSAIQGTGTTTLAFCVMVTVVAFASPLYIYYVFTIWKEEFSEQRIKRCHKESPSNKQPPAVMSFKLHKDRTLQNSKLHKAFDTCELLNDLKDKEVTMKQNEILREKARRTNYLNPNRMENSIGSLSGYLNESEEAEELNMDHIYIKFFDFLWGYIFIGPSSYILWKTGTLRLSIRQFLVKYGILQVRDFDIKTLIGQLCLEQSQVIHYKARTKKDSDHGNIAGFFFTDFPYVDGNCDYKVADLFAVDIDLDTNKFIKAKMDDLDLTASETLILLWFNTIGAQHVKLHAMANWGVNNDDAVKETNSFLHRNSVVTVIYNYFGYSSFSKFFKTWEKQGLLSKGWSEKQPFVKCFNHGIKEGIPPHSQVTELVNHSRFVNFVVKVRAIFFNEFSKHKHLFPGVHGEALFAGTVLHSLDHTLMEWNLVDPLWLDVDDPRFGKMAEIGRIVRVGFVPDVPLLYFHKRFKGSGHPFYEAVYEKAAKVDKQFADHMDTCIIK